MGPKQTSAEPAAPDSTIVESLSGVVATLDRVLETALTAEQRHQLRGARDAAASVHATMQGTLSVARPEGAPVAHPRPPQSTPTPLDILVVEDNEINQRVMVAVLESAGHAVAIADTGGGALAALREHHFDIVLMDLQMPDMDGLEATRRLRANEGAAGRHTPVIALTARAMDGDVEACLAAGADGYVSKPFQIDELLGAIDSAVRKRNSASDAGAASSSAF